MIAGEGLNGVLKWDEVCVLEGDGRARGRDRGPAIDSRDEEDAEVHDGRDEVVVGGGGGKVVTVEFKQLDFRSAGWH